MRLEWVVTGLGDSSTAHLRVKRAPRLGPRAERQLLEEVLPGISTMSWPLARRSAPGSETYGFAGTSETVVRVDTGSPTSSTTSTIDAAGSRLTVTQGTVNETTARFTVFDELGSLAALVDGSATIAASYRFDGYGNSITSNPRAANPFGFAGAINLGTDGQPLYEMGARLYAPSMGSFTQLDTYAGKAADPASMNRFAYAASNPTILVDPTGHNTIDMDGYGTTLTHDATHKRSVHHAARWTPVPTIAL